VRQFHPIWKYPPEEGLDGNEGLIIPKAKEVPIIQMATFSLERF
jgi:hypothetical protein